MMEDKFKEKLVELVGQTGSYQDKSGVWRASKVVAVEALEPLNGRPRIFFSMESGDRIESHNCLFSRFQWPQQGL